MANYQTLIDNLSYLNSSDDPNTTNRVVTITALKDDGGTANSGDDTAALSLTSTVALSATNDAPVISSGSGDTAAVNVAENTTTVTTVVSTDVDTGDTKTYSIIGGADQAKFSINSSTGALTFVSAPNYENPTDTGDTAGNNTYVVEVKVTDTNGLNDTQTITVTVTKQYKRSPNS